MLDPYPYGSRSLEWTEEESAAVKKYCRKNKIFKTVPLKHPLLQRVEGEYQIPKFLPPWWKDVLGAAKSFHHKLILSTVDGEQFHQGKVSEQKVKQLRSMLTAEEKKDIPASPSIAKWLESAGISSTYINAFNERGAKLGGVLHITTRPEDIFFMSNGYGWSSCQSHIDGDYRDRLRGAIADPLLAMAVIIPPGKKISDNPLADDRYAGPLLARVLLRVVHVVGDANPVVFIDRAYGTDHGIMSTLKAELSKLFSGMGVLHCFGYDSFPGYQYNYAVITPSFAIPADYADGYQDSLTIISSEVCPAASHQEYGFRYCMSYGSASFKEQFKA